ncbi:MAG: N-formylglutamate amidohydrolase [Mesorhizobium amorphae]|nr:MAG: N-formylglutamate amidohydrolase [Mesorhizobium amorphae]
MSAGPEDDFTDLAPFTLSGEAQHVPFVMNSPHSGRHYPARFLDLSRLDASQIRRSEDCYVDQLFGGSVGLGIPLLAANFPRAYLDVNREPFELDPRMFTESLPPFANARSPRVAGGLGTVPRLVGEGLDIYPGRLPLSEALGRIERFYKPYHDALKALVMRTHIRFGFAVLIDCHSMPASVRSGEAGRPDFIVGDRFGASASPVIVDEAVRLLAAMGYNVVRNKPYAGGFITEHYGRPAKNLHAIQIEINRGLYLDERSFKKTAGFARLADDITRFMSELSRLPDAMVDDMPIAAE